MGKDPLSTNMVFSIGEDGLLLVDTGYKEYGNAIKKKLAGFSDSIPSIIVNTHLHVDHTGNNDSFSKKPIIIAHANVRRDFDEGRYMLRGLTENSKPQIVVDNTTSIYFNGEQIKLIPIPGSHSDGDLLVYFTESNIMVLGDVGYGNKYPSFDLINGNSSLYYEIVSQILSLSNERTRYISGHGRDLNRMDLITFFNMLKATALKVKEEIQQVKDYTQIQNEQLFEEWKSFEDGFNTRETWIRDLYFSYQSPKKSIAIIPVLYEVYEREGIEATLDTYNQIKKEVHRDEILLLNLHTFSQIIYKENKNPLDAIAILKVVEKAFPNHERAFITYAYLGNLYMELKKNETAKKYLNMSLNLRRTKYVEDRIIKLN